MKVLPPSWVLTEYSRFPFDSVCFLGIRMLARRYGASKIRNAKLRAFLRYSVWVRALQPHSVELVGCLQAGVDHQLEEEAR